MELIISTKIGKLTALFEQDTLNAQYTAYFKEKPGVIVQSDNVSDCIDELNEALDLYLEVEENI